MFFFSAHTLKRRRLAAAGGVELFKFAMRAKLTPRRVESSGMKIFLSRTLELLSDGFCGVLQQ